MSRYVITYDIHKNKIRSKLFRLLERYGAWKQYSVFEMNLNPVQRVELDHAIRDIIENSDRVRIYSLCDRCVPLITEIGESSAEFMGNVV